VVADADEDAPSPEDDQDSAAPADETKTKSVQPDEQLRKAIEVLRKRETKA